jgi:hypothetical protein
VAYQLDLPPIYGNIHNVFHISLLKPWKRSEVFVQRAAPPPPPVSVDGDGSQWYEAVIMSHRKHYRKWQFLVQFTGYDKDEAKWCRVEDITEALLREYCEKEGLSVDMFMQAPPEDVQRTQQRRRRVMQQPDIAAAAPLAGPLPVANDIGNALQLQPNGDPPAATPVVNPSLPRCGTPGQQNVAAQENVPAQQNVPSQQNVPVQPNVPTQLQPCTIAPMVVDTPQLTSRSGRVLRRSQRNSKFHWIRQ